MGLVEPVSGGVIYVLVGAPISREVSAIMIFNQRQHSSHRAAGEMGVRKRTEIFVKSTVPTRSLTQASISFEGSQTRLLFESGNKSNQIYQNCIGTVVILNEGH